MIVLIPQRLIVGRTEHREIGDRIGEHASGGDALIRSQRADQARIG